MDENKNEGDEFENMQILGDDDLDDGDSVFGDDADWSAPAAGTDDYEDVPPPLFSEEVGDAGADDDWASVTGSSPRWQDADDDLPPLQPVEAVGGAEVVDDFFGYDDGGDLGDPDAIADPDLAPIDPMAPESMAERGGAYAETAPDRDMSTAIISGVAIAVLAAICFFVGPAVTVVLATILLTLAAAEYGNAMRAQGFNPPILLLLASVASLSLATYYKGDQAIPVVLVLTVVFAAFWYLAEVSVDRPVQNLGIMFLGVVWIGVLGSFAGVMLRLSGDTGMLLAAVVATVAYDVGALVVGRAAGRQPLNPASPNKTMEGLVGGVVAAVVATLIIIGFFKVGPFGNDDIGGGILETLVLGLVAGVVAPVGDLFESLLKRDLGVKDMGSIIPGHGGLLDRFDALLFVLPATYYVGRIVL